MTENCNDENYLTERKRALRTLYVGFTIRVGAKLRCCCELRLR